MPRVIHCRPHRPGVSQAALGTVTFGTDWVWGAPTAVSAKQFEPSAQAGCIFIDIATSTRMASPSRSR